ncbi:unnamed protein product [Arctia plantaginis]|uniref:Uncharacterized protein n=1 Tax=Arctia plantaginis TaxID=874455 RepID=A0A8S0ZSG1_ARCPL|nr:unnamed protein product [Arctia plantaginis]
MEVLAYYTTLVRRVDIGFGVLARKPPRGAPWKRWRWYCFLLVLLEERIIASGQYSSRRGSRSSALGQGLVQQGGRVCRLPCWLFALRSMEEETSVKNLMAGPCRGHSFSADSGGERRTGSACTHTTTEQAVGRSLPVNRRHIVIPRRALWLSLAALIGGRGSWLNRPDREEDNLSKKFPESRVLVRGQGMHG